jgi:parallel beta-helix repeat protein
VFSALAAVLTAAGPLSAAVLNVGPGQTFADIPAALSAAANGDTLLVFPGTFTIPTVTKSVSIIGVGNANTIVINTNLVQLNAGGTLLQNVTVNGTLGGVQIANGANNCVVRGVIVNASPSGNYHGITVLSASGAVISGCTVNTAFANGIYLAGSSNCVVLANSVKSTSTQYGIALEGANGNRIIGNIIGTGTLNSIAAGGIFLNSGSRFNRVEGNVITGVGSDGITATGGASFNTFAKNSVSLPAGLTAGTPIFLNDASNGCYAFGNTLTSGPECGLAVFSSSNALLEGNRTDSNVQGGILIWDAAFNNVVFPRVAPTNVWVHGNHCTNAPTNSEVILRGAISTEAAFNYLNGGGGANTGGVLVQQGGNGIAVHSNTIEGTLRNVQLSVVSAGLPSAPAATGFRFFRNRSFNYVANFAQQGVGASFDGGPFLGGNFWQTWATTAALNPDPLHPFSDIIYNAESAGAAPLKGLYVDRYPFKDETFGLTPAIRVSDPPAGLVCAPGSVKTVRWTSRGTTRVNVLLLDPIAGTVLGTIAGNVPDTGCVTWNVPNTPGTYRVAVEGLYSNGASSGVFGFSPGNVTISGSGAILLATPAGGDAYDAASVVRATWRNVGGLGGNIELLLSVDDGAYQSLGLVDAFASYYDFTLPSVAASRARLLVRTQGGAVLDETDGHFRIRGAGGSVIDPAPGSTNVDGKAEIGDSLAVRWVSVPGTALVDLDVVQTVLISGGSLGTSTTRIATGLPDSGRYRWLVPELFSNSANIVATFRDASGTVLGGATGPTFAMVYSTGTGTAVPRYRMFNNTSKAHLDTTDLNEYTVLQGQGWNPEGSGYKILNGPGSRANSGTNETVQAIPLYRIYDPVNTKHFWTTDRNEYFTLRDPATFNFRGENVDGYVFPKPVDGSIALYRLRLNPTPTRTLHVFTVDVNEYNALPASGWVQEGVVGYVLSN